MIRIIFKGDKMKKVILKIEGMSCSACQNRVENKKAVNKKRLSI